MNSATSSLTTWYLHLATGSSAPDSRSPLTRSGMRARAEKRPTQNWPRSSKSLTPTKCPERRPRSRSNGRRTKDLSWPRSNKRRTRNISMELSIGIISPTMTILAPWYLASSRKRWTVGISSEFSWGLLVTLYTDWFPRVVYLLTGIYFI